MENSIKQRYYSILGKFRPVYIALILIVGVFLFPKTAYLSTITPQNIIDLTNKERISQGATPLTANQLLTKAAREKALAIFTEQNFAHNFKDKRFSSWVRDTGYKYRYVGENLAIDFVSSEGVVKAWINSPTHYENLINDKFSEIGVAVVEDKFKRNDSIVVVQIFASPLKMNSGLKTILNENTISNNNIETLSHISNDNFNIISNKEKFLNSENKENIDFLPNTTKKNKIDDYIFTLFGFIYLGIFKLVSIKNSVI